MILLTAIMAVATAILDPAAALAAAEAELARMQAETAEDMELIEKARQTVPIAFFDPNPWQYRAIMDMVNGITVDRKNPVQYTIAHIPGNAAGKCLAKGTKVLMFDGSEKNVEDIQPFDLVMGPDSKPRTVLSTTSGIEEMVRIVPKHGEPFECNMSHMLALRHTTGTESTNLNGATRVLSVRDYLNKSKKFKHLHRLFRVGVEFKEKDVPIDPYWLGLWLGDGSQHNADITTGDKEIENYIRSHAEQLGLRVTEHPGHGCKTYATVGQKPQTNPLREMLKQLGVRNNKHIPSCYKINSKRVRLQLLAGLLDSDGHLGKSGFEFCNTNRRLAEDVLWVARSLGFKSAMHSKRTSIKSIGYHGEAWRVLIHGVISEIPTLVSRKRGHDSWRRVTSCGFSVVPLGLGTYYGFTLDGDGLFLLGDFTVTHNTYLVAAMIWSIVCDAHVRNRWFDYELFRNWPFPKHIRCIADKQLFMEGSGEFHKAITALWPHLPDGTPIGWSCEKGDYSFPSRYKLPNGFVLDCVTPEIKLRAHEGVQLGALFILEPVEEEVWDLYPRAFRYGGIKVLSCTLAHCSEWVDRRVLEKDGVIITRGTAEDNCEDSVLMTPMGEVRGKLPRTALDSMYDEMPESDRDARWNGTPIYWRGRALNGVWDESVHVVDDDAAPQMVAHKMNIDPHPGKPYCIIVEGIDAEGNQWIVDEWPRFETFGRYYHEVPYDAPDHGENFYFKLINDIRLRYSRIIPILDYKISRTPDRKDEGTSSLIERMQTACRCEFDRQKVDVGGVDGSGLTLLKSALAWDKSKPISRDNHPKLRVLRRCKNVAYQMVNLAYKRSAELGKFGTSEVFDQKFFDFPRGVMSLLSHETGRVRIVTPEEARRQQLDAHQNRIVAAAMKHHPGWKRGF